MIKNIVILTGAGISAESGIPVFRSETGLWENHRIEDVCVPSALERDPATVENFYNTMRRNLHNVEPNPAHYAVAKLQKEWKKGSVTLVTQNIDNLHERAGSESLYHMHGALREIYCPRCGTVFPVTATWLRARTARTAGRRAPSGRTSCSSRRSPTIWRR